MKQIFLSIALLFCLGPVSAQEAESSDKVNALPQVELRTLDGEEINTSELSNNGNPIIISFWATWCKPCLQELIAISEVYPDWQDETGVLLVAVSIDDAKSTAKVPTVVNGRGWEYQVLLDPNQDFKRAMGVNNPPHTFILDGEGNIVWKHTGYLQGDEDEYYDVITRLSQGETLTE